jgi:hypothetical protein
MRKPILFSPAHKTLSAFWDIRELSTKGRLAPIGASPPTLNKVSERVQDIW